MSFSNDLKAAQKHLVDSDKVLAICIKKYGPCHLKPHQDHYSELVTSIIGQQLSTRAAAAIWRRVLDLSKGKPPTPQKLINVDEQTLRSAGLSRPKVSYVKDLAHHVIDGRLDMNLISKLPNDEIINQLTAVKGIGEWSAQMFMIFSLGRLNVLPVGDLGVRKAAMNLYDLGELPNPQTLQELSKKNGWQPYESIAAWYLWKSLNNAGVRTIKNT
ncbi:DNA-3-methyladenine glycosylase 2 family protein [Candidatus Saccharibacteria bacterium]|nr:DNA-3-methyladenine glycosylase 2 family protein [Candidatus Saccharibacteria bacterium]